MTPRAARRLALIAAVGLLSLAGCATAAPRSVDPRLARVVAPPAGSGVDHVVGTFEGRGGLPLFCQSWRPRGGEPRAALIVIHGLKDHGSRYHALAERLAARGFAVHALDLRGHGNSAGERVRIDSFNDYLIDLGIYFDRVEGLHPRRPVFVFGHSMGGAIVTLWTLTARPRVAGILLSGAALAVGDDVPPPLVFATRVLSNIAPGLGVLDLPNDRFSRDPAVVAAMDEDPLVSQEPGPARTAAELLRAIETIGANMERLTAPLLVMHGGADVITNPEGSRQLHARAASADKALTIYEGLYHDLLHEPEKEQVMTDVIEWLDARARPEK